MFSPKLTGSQAHHLSYAENPEAAGDDQSLLEEKKHSVLSLSRQSQIYKHNRREVLDPAKVIDKLGKELMRAQEQLKSMDHPRWKNVHTKLLSMNDPKRISGLLSGTKIITPTLHIAQAESKCVGIAYTKDATRKTKDDHLITTLKIGDEECPLFAVLDGHRARNAVDYLKKNLISHLEKDIAKAFTEEKYETKATALFNTFKLAFPVLGEDYQKSKMWLDSVGSVAVITIIYKGDLWTINLGDCQAGLVTKNAPISLSRDATAELEKPESIKKRNGAIAYDSQKTCWIKDINQGMDRMKGVDLQPSRAFGHSEYGGVNPRPKVTCYPMQNLDEIHPRYLILTSDGYSKAASWQGTAAAMQDFFICGKTPHQMAEALALRAQLTMHPNADDITVIVVDLSKY